MIKVEFNSGEMIFISELNPLHTGEQEIPTNYWNGPIIDWQLAQVEEKNRDINEHNQSH